MNVFQNATTVQSRPPQDLLSLSYDTAKPRFNHYQFHIKNNETASLPFTCLQVDYLRISAPLSPAYVTPTDL